MHLEATKDNNNDMKILTTNLTEHDGINSFRFSILVDSPLYVFIREKLTEIKVTEENTGETIFEGRVFNSSVDWSAEQVTADYECEELTGYLHDSSMTDYEYKGLPSGLFKWIIERNNLQLEPYKQWAIGVCEIDTYRTYIEKGTTEGVNKVLQVGDRATIKATAKYIYSDWGNTRLIMASYAKGVAHKVKASKEVNGTMMYLLERTYSNGYTALEGYVYAYDIVETQTLNQGTVNTSTQTIDTTSLVRIKPTATHYYTSASGEGRTIIPSYAKQRTYTARYYSEKYKRHAIYYRGVGTAWIDEDFLIISKTNISGEMKRSSSGYVDTKRTIEVSVSHSETAYDALTKHLLEPYNAELEWTRVEGVPTLNIRNRIMRETNNVVRPSLNLINMSLSTSPDIVTVIYRKSVVDGKRLDLACRRIIK